MIVMAVAMMMFNAESQGNQIDSTFSSSSISSPDRLATLISFTFSLFHADTESTTYSFLPFAFACWQSLASGCTAVNQTAFLFLLPFPLFDDSIQSSSSLVFLSFVATSTVSLVWPPLQLTSLVRFCSIRHLTFHRHSKLSCSSSHTARLISWTMKEKGWSGGGGVKKRVQKQSLTK